MQGTRPHWTISGLAVLGNHELRLLFEDGTVGDVDFSGRDWSGVLEPLNDPAYFATAVVAHGTLYWPEHDIDLAPEPLYEAARANQLVGVTR